MNCNRSDRVTIPDTVPSRRTSTAGFDLESSFATDSTGCPASTVGKGASITSLTVASSSLGFSRLFPESAQSLYVPTQPPPYITGICETSCCCMSRIACRTVDPGATLTIAGALPVFAPSTVPSVPRSGSSIWFSRIHASS